MRWSRVTRRSVWALKKIVMDKEKAPEERFEATLELARMPRNGARVRIRNRCILTGRPARLLQKVRTLAHCAPGPGSAGRSPACVKSSW